jgi:hypothetical protein
MIDPFHEAFGPPSIRDEPMHFMSPFLEHLMSERLETIGSGWFLGRFFYLFGKGAEQFTSCLDAWAFLVPPGRNWTLIGYNAYGVLLVLDESEDRTVETPVGLLDPLTVTFLEPPGLALWGLLGVWMPQRQPSQFFDTGVYEDFLKSSGRLLEDDEILGIRRAVPLGGELNLENFTPIRMIDYYRATAPVYAEAHRQSERADSND